MLKTLILVAFLAMFKSTFSFYNESYNGYTFILPDTVRSNRSNSSRSMKLSFSDAQLWCTKNVDGSTLATIRSKDVQQDFARFTERALKYTNSNIRMNGQYHITDEWRWVNGRPTTDVSVQERNESLCSSHARLLAPNFSISSENHTETGRFICEYPDNSRTCDLLLNGRCYKKYVTSLTWYDARNVCLDEGGDLASFETLGDNNISVSLKPLLSHVSASYWIGMQKNEWRWNDTGSAIKYTNWEADRPYNSKQRCLCITRTRWEWKECGCSEPYPFICILNDKRSSPSTLRDTTEFVILAVVCAAVFVVIILVTAAFITKRRRNNDTLKAVKSPGYENSEYALIETSTDFAVYDEIMEPKATTYASVQMAAETDVELPANGIVYAELDLTAKA